MAQAAFTSALLSARRSGHSDAAATSSPRGGTSVILKRPAVNAAAIRNSRGTRSLPPTFSSTRQHPRFEFSEPGLCFCLFGKKELGEPEKLPFPKVYESLPPSLRRWGWIGFWSQLVLSMVSATVLLFSSAVTPRDATSPAVAAIATPDFGKIMGVFGLVFSFISVFWCLGYTRLAARMRDDLRLKKTTAAQNISESSVSEQPQSDETSVRLWKQARRSLRLGVLINLLGMAVTLLGAEATVGSLLGKALQQGLTMPVLFGGVPGRFVQALDIFVVQANTNTILSCLAGLVAALSQLRKFF